MSKVIKNILYILIMAVLCGLLSSTSYANADVTFTMSPNEIEIGEKATINVGIIDTEAWNLAVTASGGTLEGETSSIDANGSEITKNVISCKFSATTSGTYTISLSGNVSGSDLIKKDVSKTITIVVKEPTTSSEPGTETGNENPTPEQPANPPAPEVQTPETPTTTTQNEPTFTNKNETVYAKKDVNVRESYNTASKKLGMLKKGDEIKRTGIGSNGWSKVDYNGKTAYISTAYLTTTKPEEKSNNTNLKSLTIENQTLSPKFTVSNTSYSLQVPNDITKLNINAEAEDAKATVTINGNEDLKEGENIVTVSVSSEDGSVKIYEIKVTRLASETTTNTLGLKSLKIKDTNIENKFETDVYEYEINIKDEKDLKIEAIANDDMATVEIIGNEDLQEGENIITIIVSSQDGAQKVTYQIKVNKSATATTNQTKKNIDNKIYMYIALVVVSLIALIIIIVYIIKSRNKVEEFDEEVMIEELPERKQTEDEEQNNTNYFLDDYDKQKNQKGKHF